MKLPLNDGELVADVLFFDHLAGEWCVPSNEGTVSLAKVVCVNAHVLPTTADDLLPARHPQGTPPFSKERVKNQLKKTKCAKKPTNWSVEELEKLGECVRLPKHVKEKIVEDVVKWEHLDFECDVENVEVEKVENCDSDIDDNSSTESGMSCSVSDH